MLKRILIIAFFTGSGQLLSVFVLRYLAAHASTGQLRAIAEIDSLVLFIMNLVALGLQPSAMRNLALASDWKQEYHETQSARLTLGMLLMAAAALAFFNEYYLLFLAAPILAWSGDYALYARGMPITGAIIAFVRLVLPFAALLAGTYLYPDALGWIYAGSLLAVYVITNACISFFLGVNYFFTPSIHSLRLYVSSLPLGAVALSLYFLGQGLLLIVPYFYGPAEIVGVVFLGLKLYVIFKGVLRIIHQAFIKEMQYYATCLKVDQLCGLIGLTFAAFMASFPETSIGIFFGKQYYQYKMFFILLAVAALIYSLFSSLTTKAMLEKKDRPYAITASVAALATLALCVVLSYFRNTPDAIGISLLSGEILFAAGMLRLATAKQLLAERARFFAGNAFFIAIPLALRLIMGDQMTAFILSATAFCGILAAVHYKKFTAMPQQV